MKLCYIGSLIMLDYQQKSFLSNAISMEIIKYQKMILLDFGRFARVMDILKMKSVKNYKILNMERYGRVLVMFQNLIPKD